jgi:carboxymethylenebutenolidase
MLATLVCWGATPGLQAGGSEFGEPPLVLAQTFGGEGDHQDPDGGTGTLGRELLDSFESDEDFGGAAYEGHALPREDQIESAPKEKNGSTRRGSRPRPRKARSVRSPATSSESLPRSFGGQMGLMPLVQRRKEYGQIGNQSLKGYFATPEGPLPGKPGIVLIHDWWGLRPWVEQQADRLAQAGYTVLAVDLYGGKRTRKRDVAFQLGIELLENRAVGLENLKQALITLRAQGCKRIATMGWVRGADFALGAGLEYPELVDAVVVYGSCPIAKLYPLKRLDAPLLGIFTSLEKGVSGEIVPAFRRRLEKLKKTHTIKVYPNAGVAFANPPPDRIQDLDHWHPSGDAKDAWERCLNFLKLHLVPEE